MMLLHKVWAVALSCLLAAIRAAWRRSDTLTL